MFGLPEGFSWVNQEEDTGFESGLASTFGYNDPEDNGIGAWGDVTNDENAFGVALPISTLREIFGDDDKAHNAVVEVTNPRTGAKVKAPIVDKGPANWVLDRQGPTIDVTEGVRRMLGMEGGLEPMEWRVLGHGESPDAPSLKQTGLPEGFSWASNTNIAKQGAEVTTGLPEGFTWVSKTAAPASSEEDVIPLEPVSQRPGGVEPPGLTPQNVKGQANRAELLHAIELTEKAGYKVPHTIGTDTEPEGDRAPTIDQENLVTALKKQEADQRKAGNTFTADGIAKDISYWENKIKTEGMSAEQAAAAEAPLPEGFQWAKPEAAAPAPSAAAQSPLPTMSTLDADRLGLPRWRDLESGMEVRRATLPEGFRWKTDEDSYGKSAAAAKVAAPQPLPPDYRPEWQPPAPEAPPDYRPEWQPAPQLKDVGRPDVVDAVNMFGRGASSEGLLATLEGGYAAVANNAPEGTIRDNAIKQRDEVAAMRERIRKQHLPVDRAMEESMVGQIMQGGGQMVANIPAYAIGPYVGTAVGGTMAALQLYDEARQDYIATQKARGKPVDEAAANKAAMQYVAAAGPVELAADKFIVGKFLKAAAKEGKTIGSVIKEGAQGFATEGSTEAGQQAWLNYVANTLSKYDPERPMTKELATSFIVGGAVGGGVTTLGAAMAKPAPAKPAPAAPATTGFPLPPEEQAKLDKMRETLTKGAPAPAAAPAEAPVTVTPDRPKVAPDAELPEGYTYQPTSDQELNSMIEDLVRGRSQPVPQTQAKEQAAVSASVAQPGKTNESNRQRAQKDWDALSPLARFDDIVPELTLYQNQAKALGLEFDLRDGNQSPAIVVYDDGRVTLRGGAQSIFLRKHSSNLPGDAEARIALGEETIHAGDILGLRKMWDKSAEQKLGVDFIDYINNHGVSVFNDIATTIEEAPIGEQAGLYQAMADSFNAYYGDYGDMSGVSKTPTDYKVIEHIRKYVSHQGYSGPQMIGSFVREFNRMAKQQQSQGILSEHTARNLSTLIMDWVKATLDRIVKALPGVREGKFGKEAQKELQRIDDTLKELGASIPKVSQEERAMGISGARARKPSLLEKMKETFRAKPAAPAVSPELRAEMERLAYKDRVRAAIQVGGETFVADTHYAAMKAAKKKLGAMNLGDAVMGNTDYAGNFLPFERAEMRQGLKEGPATVNIGLATDDGKGITEAQVLKALRDAGVNVTSHRIEQSGTEPTVVAYLDKTLEPEEALKLAVDLDQEAIAEAWQGGEEIYGPMAEAWRPFNREFFISQKNPDPELVRGLDELETLAKDYEKYRRWYKDFSAFLDRVLLPENRIYKPLITDFMAATSVMTGIKPNVEQSIAKLREFVETGSITAKGVGFPPASKLPNLMKAIRGERLGGPKVGPFSQALRLDPNAAAIDRHVAMVLFNTRAPSEAQIRVGQKVAQQIAERLGWETAEVQAAWWAAGKNLYGERGKAVETYEQFYEQYQDELNAILTADREGEGRGLRAVGAIRAGAGKGVGLPGTRGPPRRAEPAVQEQRQGEGLPGLVEVDRVKREGGYLISPDGDIYAVRGPGADTHLTYVERFMGVKLDEGKNSAFSQGWVRVINDPSSKTVYYDGLKFSNAAMRTIKDIGAELGYDVYKDLSTLTMDQYRDRVSDSKAPQVQEARGGTTAPTTGAVPATQRPTINRLFNLPQRTTDLAGKKSWHWGKGPAMDLTRFWNGTADVFNKTKGLEWMGAAIRKHVDLRAKYKGRYTAELTKAWGTVPRTRRKEALQDFNTYWQTNQEKGKAAADALTISPHARSLIDATKSILNEMGDLNQQRHVHVFDPAIGGFRPIGKIGSSGNKDYFPRMIKTHILDILHNAAHNPVAWNELRDQLIAEGKIDPANADADMLKYVENVVKTYRMNGFFGSLDMARSPFLPNRAYDYSFDVVRRYVESWSERMAQIEAFGQKLGTQGKDLFDVAQERAGDLTTQRYVQRVRDLAYNAQIETAWGRAVAAVNNVATATQLAQFAATMKNFLSGQGFNWQNMSTLTFLKSFADIHATFREIKDGYERGVLQDDLMNIMRDGESELGQPSKTGRLAGFALKASGFTAAETWVRGTAMVGARAMWRSAAKAYNKNRRSSKTRKWLAYFQYLGLDGEALILEGGKGDLFDAYMRRSVNEIQGGYSYADVPAFMDESVGRFLLKYQKWGSEQLKHFLNGAVKPAVRWATFRQGFKEKVTITNPDGSTSELTVPGAIMPLARYIWVLALVGAGSEWGLEKIFGRFSKTASLAQIMATWRRDKMEAFTLGLQKTFGYLLMAGAGGTLGNYAQMGMDFTERTRFKNPFDPPGLAPFKETINAAIDLWDRGTINIRNVDEFLERTVGAYRTSKQMGARVQDALGVAGFRELELVARRQDYSWLRSVTRRYDKSIGARQNVRFQGRAGESETSNFRDEFFEDLVLGDKTGAARRLEKHLAGMSDERRKVELRNLKQSVGGRQPIKVGAGGGDREAMRQNFLAWAHKNLGPEEVARIKRVDGATYRSTAQALDLMKEDEIVPEVNLEKAMERIRMLSE